MIKILLSAKCSDQCSVVIKKDDDVIHEEADYVPDYIPNFFGDCVEMEIDPETGTILNWEKNKVMAFIKGLQG